MDAESCRTAHGRRESMLLSAVFAGMLASAPCTAQDGTSGPVTVNPGELRWVDAPPTLPKGSKMVVLFGDPGKPGPYVLRLMAPAGYKIGAHWHSQAENLTVLSGTLYLGEGDKADRNKVHPLKSGGYHFLPAKQHHYVFVRTPTIVQVNGDGPFDINYINPEDNPERAQR